MPLEKFYGSWADTIENIPLVLTLGNPYGLGILVVVSPWYPKNPIIVSLITAFFGAHTGARLFAQPGAPLRSLP